MKIFVYENKKDLYDRTRVIENNDGSKLVLQREWKFNTSQMLDKYLWECSIAWPFGYCNLHLYSDNGKVTYTFNSENMVSTDEYIRDPFCYSYPETRGRRPVFVLFNDWKQVMLLDTTELENTKVILSLGQQSTLIGATSCVDFLHRLKETLTTLRAIRGYTLGEYITVFSTTEPVSSTYVGGDENGRLTIRTVDANGKVVFQNTVGFERLEGIIRSIESRMVP